MKIKNLLLLLALFFVGCGSSSDFDQVSGNSPNPVPVSYSNATSSVSLQASSGTITRTTDTASVQLSNLSNFTATTESGVSESISFEEFRNRIASASHAVLTYRIDGLEVRRGIDLTSIQADLSSLNLQYSLDRDSGPSPEVTEEAISDVHLIFAGIATSPALEPTGRVQVHYASHSSLFFDASDVSTEDSFEWTVYNQTDVWFDLWANSQGQDYTISVYDDSTEPVYTTTHLELDKVNSLTMAGRRAPKGASTGSVAVHVGFDDLFNTDANRNIVELREQNQSEVAWSGITDSDGDIEFRGLPSNVGYQITVYDDDEKPYYNNSVFYAPANGGILIHRTVKGHF